MGKRPRSQMEPRAASAHPSVSHLYKDIRRFETDHKIPAFLDDYVFSERDVQVLWYKELLEAWPNSDAPQSVTPQEAAKHVLDALQKVKPEYLSLMDLNGFLDYYKLTKYRQLPTYPPRGEASSDDAVEKTHEELMSWFSATDFFVLNTLPVSKEGVTDGCCFTVSVEVERFHILPFRTVYLISKRRSALCKGDKAGESRLLELINAGDYQIKEINDVEVVTKEYHIKLRGLEESGMPNGDEARDKLVKMVHGKRLMIKVFYIDEKLRCVGDAYFNGTLLQDNMELADHTPGVGKGD